MSVTINIENFQTWSEVFKEIERQKNLRTFTVIERDIHHQERKPRCSAAMEVRRTKFCKQGRRVGITQCKIDQTSCHIQQSGRLVSTPGPSDRDKRGQNKEQLPIQCREVQTCFQPCVRIKSAPSLGIGVDPDELLSQDSRLTDAARKLSREEMALLYEDILKPLDVFSILRERRRGTEEHGDLFQ